MIKSFFLGLFCGSLGGSIAYLISENLTVVIWGFLIAWLIGAIVLASEKTC